MHYWRRDVRPHMPPLAVLAELETENVEELALPLQAT